MMTKTAFRTQRIGEENEADQDEAEDRGDDVVDEHRDLEVERFLAVRVDLGRVVALGQPDDERPEQVTGEMKEDAEQGAGVAERAPGAHVGEGGGADGSGGGDGYEVSMVSNEWMRLGAGLDSKEMRKWECGRRRISASEMEGDANPHGDWMAIFCRGRKLPLR